MVNTGKVIYKGVQALYIENENIKAVFTVKGAKMVSLFDKTAGRELLLQSTGDVLLQGSYDSDYNTVDVCGFDDMFPTIDVCYYEGFPWNGIKLPDHGEVWSLDWTAVDDRDFLAISVNGIRLPYNLLKIISIQNETVLRIDYRLLNRSPFDMEFLWAAHIMLSMEDDAVVVLPGCHDNKGIVTYSSDNLLGVYGDHFEINKKFTAVTLPPDGPEVWHNAILAGRPYPKYMDKFYLHGPVSSGQASVMFPSDGRRYRFMFPEETVPYFGFLTTKGYHLQNCVILEPCTAAFDRIDRAKAYGCGSIVSQSGCYDWFLEIIFE